MIVTVLYQTIIPSDVVTYYLAGVGGSYSGGIKSTLEVQIDLNQSGVNSHSLVTRTWPITHEYSDDDALPVSGKPDWFRSLKSGAKPTDSKALEVTDSNLNATWFIPDGASHGTHLLVAGGNPLKPAAPAIDGEFDVGFLKEGENYFYKVFSNAGVLTKDHDGFPDHIIQINGAVVYKHDCVVTGNTPFSLAPPSEVTIVSEDWKPIV